MSKKDIISQKKQNLTLKGAFGAVKSQGGDNQGHPISIVGQTECA
jgi:hypothetical protein